MIPEQISLRIRDVTDLLAYIPHQLGFHPELSVVVQAVRSTSDELGPMARVNLRDLADPVAGEALADRIGATFGRMRGLQAHVVVYHDAPARRRRDAALDTLVRSEVLDPDQDQVWAIAGDTYREMTWDAGWREGEAREYEQVSLSEMNVSLIHRGSHPLGSRRELLRLPAVGAAERTKARRTQTRVRDACVLAGDAEQRAAWRQRELKIWSRVQERAIRGEGALTGAEAGHIVAAIEDRQVGEAIVRQMYSGLESVQDPGGDLAQLWQHRPEPRLMRAASDLLKSAAAHVEEPERGRAFALLALISWLGGDGALASVSAERSLQIDPGQALARMVDRLLLAAAPPPWYGKAAAPR